MGLGGWPLGSESQLGRPSTGCEPPGTLKSLPAFVLRFPRPWDGNGGGTLGAAPGPNGLIPLERPPGAWPFLG